MDSRIIFESNRIYINRIVWTKEKPELDSEWQTFDINNPVSLAKIEEIIKAMSNGNTFYLSLGRHNSLVIENESILNEIKELLSKESFHIWNKDFTSVIEFNKMGVFRYGKTTG